MSAGSSSQATAGDRGEHGQGTVEDWRGSRQWFVVVESDDREWFYDRAGVRERLVHRIADGTHRKDDIVVVHEKGPGGKWRERVTSVGGLAKRFLCLRSLYEPVMAHAWFGLKLGAYVGLGLKFVDLVVSAAIARSLPLAAVAVGYAVLVAAAVVLEWAPARFRPWGHGMVLAGVLLCTQVGGIGLLVLPLLALLILLSWGGVAGLLGMSAGAVVGLARRSGLPRARDASWEDPGAVALAIVAPLLGGLGLLAVVVSVTLGAMGR